MSVSPQYGDLSKGTILESGHGAKHLWEDTDDLRNMCTLKTVSCPLVLKRKSSGNQVRTGLGRQGIFTWFYEGRLQ